MNPNYRIRSKVLVSLLLSVPFLISCTTSVREDRSNSSRQENLAAASISTATAPLVTATLTGPERDATKLAPLEWAERTSVARATRYAMTTTRVPRTFEPMPTRVLSTPELGRHGCGGYDRQYDNRNCWTERIDDGYIGVYTRAPLESPSQVTLQVVTVSLDLLTEGPMLSYAIPEQVGLVRIASFEWPRITLVTLPDNPVERTFVFNLLSREWETPPPPPAPTQMPLP